MSDTTAPALLKIVSGRRGHFRLESGHHGALWLDLDALFAEPKRIEPFVSRLVAAIRPYDVAAVCGPLLGGAFLAQLVARDLDADFCFTERAMSQERGGLYQARYHVPSAFGNRLHGERVAIVDDVMSAGSALRGTYAEMKANGAEPVVAGALLVLGDVGAQYFAQHSIPVVSVARDEYELWPPEKCPLCAANVPLEGLAPRD
jgi:orotate phosphoribosyltransferase